MRFPDLYLCPGHGRGESGFRRYGRRSDEGFIKKIEKERFIMGNFIEKFSMEGKVALITGPPMALVSPVQPLMQKLAECVKELLA